MKYLLIFFILISCGEEKELLDMAKDLKSTTTKEVETKYVDEFIGIGPNNATYNGYIIEHLESDTYAGKYVAGDFIIVNQSSMLSVMNPNFDFKPDGTIEMFDACETTGTYRYMVWVNDEQKWFVELVLNEECNGERVLECFIWPRTSDQNEIVCNGIEYN